MSCFPETSSDRRPRAAAHTPKRVAPEALDLTRQIGRRQAVGQEGQGDHGLGHPPHAWFVPVNPADRDLALGAREN